MWNCNSTYCQIMKLLWYLWHSGYTIVLLWTLNPLSFISMHTHNHTNPLSLTLKSVQYVSYMVHNVNTPMILSAIYENHRYNEIFPLLFVFCITIQSIGNWANAIHFLSTADKDTFCCILSVPVLYFASDNHLALGMKTGRDTVIHCQEHWLQNRAWLAFKGHTMLVNIHRVLEHVPAFRAEQSGVLWHISILLLGFLHGH